MCRLMGRETGLGRSNTWGDLHTYSLGNKRKSWGLSQEEESQGQAKTLQGWRNQLADLQDIKGRVQEG